MTDELTQEYLDEVGKRLRERVQYACIMPDGGGVIGRTAAIDLLCRYESARGAWDKTCGISTQHLNAQSYLAALLRVAKEEAEAALREVCAKIMEAK